MTTSVSFAEADRRFALSSTLVAFDETQDVIVLEAGTCAATDIDLDCNSYAVDGDLTVDGTLRAGDESHFLFVRGNLSVRNLLIGGPLVHVTGNVTASHAIHTDYNHGMLVVGGTVRAAIIAAEHTIEVGGAVDCPCTIDFGGFQVRDQSFTPTVTQQQWRRDCGAVFVPEVLNEQGWVDGSALAELLADGRNPLNALT